MKNEISKITIDAIRELLDKTRENSEIAEVLKGIDKDEIDSDIGWWETSTGAKFGSVMLYNCIAVEVRLKRQITELQPDPKNITITRSDLDMLIHIINNPNSELHDMEVVGRVEMQLIDSQTLKLKGDVFVDGDFLAEGYGDGDVSDPQ